MWLSRCLHCIHRSTVNRIATVAANAVSTVPRSAPVADGEPPYLDPVVDYNANGRKVYLETYGCQMNFSDATIVRSILNSVGYAECRHALQADVILLMTCAIRQSAEDRIWKRIQQLRSMLGKKSVCIGVLGCMANKRNVEKQPCNLALPNGVDLMAGPDSYRDLPRLLATCYAGHKAANIILSFDETYSDIRPVHQHNAAFAYISIMRGCNNMCTYCIVPFTRGRERSRPMASVADEFRSLCDQGVREVTLLGQNVNSYCDTSTECTDQPYSVYMSAGFKSINKHKVSTVRFAQLLDRLATIDPSVRIRFTSPHPKDFPDEVLYVMKEHKNICKCIHLPAQSGSDAVLERMRRGHTVESYLRLVDRIRSVLPDTNLTSDFISGFCGETEEDHRQTVNLIRSVGYSYCFTFAYSMRQRTKAHYWLVDDVPTETKKRRLRELHDEFRRQAAAINCRLVGSRQAVLVEKQSKRSPDDWMGRTDGNTKVVFPKTLSNVQNVELDNIQVGNTVIVEITAATSETLRGNIVKHAVN